MVYEPSAIMLVETLNSAPSLVRTIRASRLESIPTGLPVLDLPVLALVTVTEEPFWTSCLKSEVSVSNNLPCSVISGMAVLATGSTSPIASGSISSSWAGSPTGSSRVSSEGATGASCTSGGVSSLTGGACSSVGAVTSSDAVGAIVGSWVGVCTSSCTGLLTGASESVGTNSSASIGGEVVSDSWRSSPLTY